MVLRANFRQKWEAVDGWYKPVNDCSWFPDNSSPAKSDIFWIRPNLACQPNSKKPGSELERNCGPGVAFVLVLAGGWGRWTKNRGKCWNLDENFNYKLPLFPMVGESWSELRVNVGEEKGLWRIKMGQKVPTNASGKARCKLLRQLMVSFRWAVDLVMHSNW